MKAQLSFFLSLLLAAPLSADLTGDLDGSSGFIYKTYDQSRTCEFLREIGYDPKDNPGRNRFTIGWTDETKVTRVEEKKSFEGIAGPVVARFHGIDQKNAKELAEGRPFEARVVTLFSGVGEEKIAKPESANEIMGWLTPAEDGARRGMLKVDGKNIPVSLRKRHWRIYHHQPLKPTDLAKSFWKATIHGAEKDGKFVVESMEVVPRPDPRQTDDPKLPRVLVIGDSISMNYHEAAKEALEGVANYHRNEGNGSSALHGVNNAELWLGEYQEKGLHWDVIQFNHGLHDLKQKYDAENDEFGEYSIAPADYQANLEKVIAILRKTGAKLIFATTTPVPNHNKGQYARRKGAAKDFNALALEVMAKHPDIIINDLYGAVEASPIFDNWRKQSDVHFYKDEEKKVLGEAVAKAVKEALEG